MHHIKEVVDTLDKIVREEGIQHVVVAGAEVAMPILREQLPKHLADKIRRNRSARGRRERQLRPEDDGGVA